MKHRKRRQFARDVFTPEAPMELYRENKTAHRSTVINSRCINVAFYHQDISVRHINDVIQTDFQYYQYIKACTISQRLRDCVAGAFVKNSIDVTPLQSMAASTQFSDATALRRKIMDNTPRSLLGNFHGQIDASSAVNFLNRTPPSSGKKPHSEHRLPILTRLRKGFFPTHGKRSSGQTDVFQTGVDLFSQTLPFFLSGDNRTIGFSDMGPVSALISHKTAKNGIPAVRTIAFGQLSWKTCDFPKQYYRKCRCFLLDVADGYAHGALKPGFNAPISTSCF